MMHITALTVLTAGLLAAGLATPGHAATAERPPTLRVVEVGYSPAPALEDRLEMAVEACMSDKPAQAKRPAMPSSAELARLVTFEREALFDGEFWAEYVTQSTVGADAARGCAPVVYREFHVRQQKGCEAEWVGYSAPTSVLASGTAPTAGDRGYKAGTAGPGCPAKPAPAMNLQGLKRQATGNGDCVWNADLLARDMRKAGMPVADSADDELDVCLLAVRPVYQHRGPWRNVTVMTRHPAGGLMEAMLYVGGRTQLKTLEEGQPIAAERFGRAGAERFIQQVAKQPLGGTR